LFNPLRQCEYPLRVTSDDGTGHPFTYDAFLSYSHAVDGKLAPALREGLHRFAKRPGTGGEPGAYFTTRQT